MKFKSDIDTLKCILGLVLIAIILLILSSCYNMRKAVHQTNRALVEYPAVVAKIARDAFPCIITKSDTLISYTDTTIIVNCPTGNDFEGGDISMAGDIVKHDTLNKHDTFPHFIKVPFRIAFKTIDITQHIADSAQNKMLQSVIDNRDITISKMQLVLDSNAETIKRKNKYVLAFWVIIGLFAAGIILKQTFKRL